MNERKKGKKNVGRKKEGKDDVLEHSNYFY